jgi:hypothetical protein
MGLTALVCYLVVIVIAIGGAVGVVGGGAGVEGTACHTASAIFSVSGDPPQGIAGVGSELVDETHARDVARAEWHWLKSWAVRVL